MVSKTMLMSWLTLVQRRKNMVPSPNPEDFRMLNIQMDEKKLEPNQDVERVRRCHLNDLENVIPFVLVGLLYVTTKPDPGKAALHFRLFAGFRIFHTVAYLLALPQPSRAFGFLGGWITTASMAICVLKSASY